MRVRLSPQNTDLPVSGNVRVGALLKQLRLLPGTVIVIRGDNLLTEDELLRDEDEIEIRSVISGGL